jgi:simple sugar transport system ATP-binding protein
MGNNYLVEMKNICKNYGPVQALKNVDFEVGRGEIVGLVGDNAAGKSTLMKILSGAVMPTSGDIYIDGVKRVIRTPRDTLKLGIEMVYQNLAVFGGLDIKGNIFIGREKSVGGLFGGKFLKFFLNEKAMAKESRILLDKLHINIDSVNYLVKNLSGGQRQCVAIARALLFDARLIIMDEPTSALAVKEVAKILELILELKKRGKSVVLISHRMEDIMKVTDRIVVLRRGEKVGTKYTKQTDLKEIVSLIVGTGTESREAETVKI